MGRILAARLRYEHVDLDAVVVKRAGMPIPRIFRTHGEGEFRRLESASLRGLSTRERIVVSTGGGAPVEPENHGFFRVACTFFLHVSFDEFRHRTGGDRNRPLLTESAEDLFDRFERRQRVYEELGVRIETDHRRPEDVSSDILTIFRRPRGSDTS